MILSFDTIKVTNNIIHGNTLINVAASITNDDPSEDLLPVGGNEYGVNPRAICFMLQNKQILQNIRRLHIKRMNKFIKNHRVINEKRGCLGF